MSQTLVEPVDGFAWYDPILVLNDALLDFCREDDTNQMIVFSFFTLSILFITMLIKKSK